MAYIYKITNDINQKVYIGKTYHSSIMQRFKEHYKDAFKESEEKRPLYAAMRKYGIEHFHIEEIEETNIPEEREKYWIEKYGSFLTGYNAILGGDGRPYADYSLIYSLWEQGKTCKEIKDITHYDQKTIKAALKNNHIDDILIKDRGHKATFKKVAKIDPKTKEILQVYSSIAEAENNNGNTRHIADVCKGTRKTCKGYIWQYI